MSYGQVLNVTDLYTNNKYFFPDFEYLGEDAGFTQQRINCLLQDYEGYVWIGSVEGGLFRYDGYSFQPFQHDIADPWTLTGSEVYFIFEDSRNMLWVGTELALCLYTRLNNQFIKIQMPDFHDQPMVKTAFTCMTEDDQGNLYAGTSNGLIVITDSVIAGISSCHEPFFYMNANQIKVVSPVVGSGGFPESEMQIKDLQFDEFSNLWAIIKNKVGKFDLNKSIHQHNTDGKENIFDVVFETLSDGNMIRKLFIDKEGTLWITSPEQLIKIVPQKDTCNIETIPCNSSIQHIGDFNSINTTSVKYWLGNISNNLLLLDSDREKFFPLTFQSGNTDNLHNSMVSCFLQTRSGVIFTGTSWGGLFKCDPNAVLSYFHPDLQNIHLRQPANLRYALEDSKGFIWMIVKDIYRCDKNTGRILATYTDSLFGQIRGYKNKLLEDQQGRFWIAMEGQA